MLSSTITARIDAFTKELEKLVREAAVAAVQEALSPDAAPAASAGRTRAPSRGRGKAASKKSAPAAKSAPAKRSVGRPKGPATAAKPAAGEDAGSAKPSGEMDAATIAYVKAHPGLRLEEIAKALRVPSPSLKGRVAQLIETKKLRKTGKTRGTKYFVP